MKKKAKKMKKEDFFYENARVQKNLSLSGQISRKLAKFKAKVLFDHISVFFLTHVIFVGGESR